MARKLVTIADFLPSRVWLMKTEPDVFSFDDLEKRPQQQEKWEGVRNYQARNFMRDHMRVGDLVLFYHSSCTPPGIVGEAEIVKGPEPDLSALDKKSEYYDEKATKADPRWTLVTVGKPSRYAKFVELDTLRNTKQLAEMLVIRPGQRLSIQPVTDSQLKIVRELGCYVKK